jgi:hypothetical protein
MAAEFALTIGPERYLNWRVDVSRETSMLVPHITISAEINQNRSGFSGKPPQIAWFSPHS